MKNKKTTIYELIGLIKDGKAPKKIKYNGATYEYDGEDYYLETSHDYRNFSLFDRLQNSNTIKDLLTLTVEILPEENDEQHIEMQFPNTFEEFIKSYSFVDDKEIYTNGSELIPTFRLKQWIEHKKEENDEWEDIEEINVVCDSIEFYDDEKVRHFMNTNAKDRNIYIAKINKLIKNQKYLKEKLESKDEK